MEHEAAVKDRFVGCLLGAAVGDALGATLEFLSAQAVRDRYGKLTEMVGGGWLSLSPGEYTDDTQMTLCIVDSILANGGEVVTQDIAARFVAWMETRPKDIGGLTHRALRLLQKGVPPILAGKYAWEEAGSNAAGNGGVMRTAPLGLLYAFTPEGPAPAAEEVCALTHYDPRCREDCMILSSMTASLVREGTIPRTAVCHAEFDPAAHTTGYTRHTTDLALWALFHAENFEDALVEVVNLGGDADTTGAVAGALLGARFGASAIPVRWLAALQNAGEIRERAEALYDLARAKAGATS